VKSFGKPTLVLGGGGYNIRSVSRCWTYETAVLLDEELPNIVPVNDYYSYYGPDYNLHLEPLAMRNENPKEVLESIRNKVLENLGYLVHAPSVQFHQVPGDFFIESYRRENNDLDSNFDIGDLYL